MLNTMLDECLCLLALVNKEYNNNRQNCNKINGMANNNREQKFASKKVKKYLIIIFLIERRWRGGDKLKEFLEKKINGNLFG